MDWAHKSWKVPSSVLPDTQSHAARGRRDGLALAASPGSLRAQWVPTENQGHAHDELTPPSPSKNWTLSHTWELPRACRWATAGRQAGRRLVKGQVGVSQ